VSFILMWYILACLVDEIFLRSSLSFAQVNLLIHSFFYYISIQKKRLASSRSLLLECQIGTCTCSVLSHLDHLPTFTVFFSFCSAAWDVTFQIKY
jgi:hypothetical protein